MGLADPLDGSTGPTYRDIALNPNPHSHTAAVLTMPDPDLKGCQGLEFALKETCQTLEMAPVEVFDASSGVVLQHYIPGTDVSGSYSGISYSAGGTSLVFSQDSSNVTIAKVTKKGFLGDYTQVSLPPNNSFITCFPNSPDGSDFPVKELPANLSIHPPTCSTHRNSC